ncbi:MAG: topoisomerase DNA-binding C4 zinc finger domain-containing protein [Verrucomicrobiae bacterium]|nr:topoisomerase DNA-binding C4 zinc finger domain-containing protein [Verrucomicrobiae bacterium]
MRHGRRGEFLACSGYPNCKNAMGFARAEDGTVVPQPAAEQAVTPPDTPVPDTTCEKCGSPMTVKLGRRGAFLACTAYPKCKSAKPLPAGSKATATSVAKTAAAATEEKCDKCGAPMVQRRGRFGPFLACSAYPKCKNTRTIPKQSNQPQTRG